MNAHLPAKHLTPGETARWLVEGPTTDAQAHLESCRLCRAKLAAAREPLTLFRGAVIAWSEGQPVPALRSQSGACEPRLPNRTPTAIFAFAVLLLLCFLAGSAALRRHAGAPDAAQASAPLSDAVLINQVDEEVSELVPAAMAPLADLVAWDSGSGAAAAARPQPEKSIASGPRSKANRHVLNWRQ